MNVAELTLEDYEKLQPACTIKHNGTEFRYLTPNRATKWRVDTLFSKEIDTVAWIDMFDPGDVLVDIGANVGMYSILAAKSRGARVFAFEPESQNYAQLNRNIQVNGLSEQVTAYCLALADAVGFDKFYLSSFDLGGSCHSFGECVNFELKPMKPAHIQGSIAATLDGLVEEGIIPVPQHIKIDVDGFEHKVISGAGHVLDDPRLKSVLIEINQNLEPHRQLIQQMQERGFHYSQTQVDLTVRTEGAFKGAANFIFCRSPAMAEAVGSAVAATVGRGAPINGAESRPAPRQTNGNGAAHSNGAAAHDAHGNAVLGQRILVAEPTIVDTRASAPACSIEDAFKAVIDNIDRAPLQTQPYPYFYLDQVFPASFYATLLENLPGDDYYQSITKTGRVQGMDDGAEKWRAIIGLAGDEDLTRLPPELRRFWMSFREHMCGQAFATSLLNKFQAQIAQLYRDRGDSMRLSLDALLMRDSSNYEIGPHSDSPSRILSMLMYLPKDASQERLGTSIYTPKDPSFTCPGGPHHQFKDFDRVGTVPYRPNSGMCFLKTPNSFHGVEPITEPGIARDLIAYIIRWADTRD